MAVALVRPNTASKMFKIFSESLALGYLSAVLRENGIETSIIDCYLEDIKLDDLIQRVLKGDYHIIGFTISNPSSLEWTAKASQLIKKEKPGVHIVIGGHTPSFDYEYILQVVPQIDSVARFEGEYILLNLARAIINKHEWRTTKGLSFRDQNKVIANELMPLISDLDELPFPQRDYLPYLIDKYPDDYSVYINRGRGCYRRCTFCSVPSFFTIPNGKIIRQRSNENLILEIEKLVTTYMVDNFTFIDDIFILPSKEGKKNTIQLAEGLKRRGLKIYFSIAERIDNLDEEVIEELISSGLIRIFVGLEAATQEILDKLDKRISKKIMEERLTWLLTKNIDIEISFINFLPFNTLKDIRENINFFSQWGLDILRSLGNRLEPYPGTAIHDALRMEGNLARNGFFYNYIRNTVDPKVDVLYNIIQPSIPFLALISHQLRTTKTLFWKKKTLLKNFDIFYNYILLLQKAIVFEVRELFLILIDYLEHHEKIDINQLRSEIYEVITAKAEKWLSFLLEIKKQIKQEVLSHDG